MAEKVQNDKQNNNEAILESKLENCKSIIGKLEGPLASMGTIDADQKAFVNAIKNSISYVKVYNQR